MEHILDCNCVLPIHFYCDLVLALHDQWIEETGCPRKGIL